MPASAGLLRLLRTGRFTFGFEIQPSRNFVEYAVDEAARVLIAIAFRQLDRLVDSDARRDVSDVDQLVNRHSQNIMVDSREPVDRPMLERGGDQFVERRSFGRDSIEQLDGKAARLGVGRKV